MSTHFPPPVGPTWGQWTCISSQYPYYQTENLTYIWTHLGEYDVDCSADNVIAPCLVIVTIWLLWQYRDAFFNAGVLNVWTSASHLSDSTELLNGLHLGLWAWTGGARCALHPIVQIWYPCVVFDNRPLLIKFPKCNLNKSDKIPWEVSASTELPVSEVQVLSRHLGSQVSQHCNTNRPQMPQHPDTQM